MGVEKEHVEEEHEAQKNRYKDIGYSGYIDVQG